MHWLATLYTLGAGPSWTVLGHCKAARTTNTQNIVVSLFLLHNTYNCRNNNIQKLLILTWPKNRKGRRKVRPRHIHNRKPSEVEECLFTSLHICNTYIINMYYAIPVNMYYVYSCNLCVDDAPDIRSVRSDGGGRVFCHFGHVPLKHMISE